MTDIIKSIDNSIGKSNNTCTDCMLKKLCLPTAVNETQVAQLNPIIKSGRTHKKNEYLYRDTDPFLSFFVVRSGAVKTYSVSEEGDEQVTGFYLPGEVLGVDGISSGKHCNFAQVLESSSVCEIPFNQLQLLASEIPSLQRHFYKLMSKEILLEQHLLMLLSKKNADERLAYLLVSLSTRNASRGLSSARFNLPMSRVDIANYLGVAIETVSRSFSRLQKKGVIDVEGRDVKVLDEYTLHHYSNRECQQSFARV